MRVVVMGGAGDMASRTVEDLCATEDVRCVTIADRDEPGARRVAASVAHLGTEVVVARVDANDHDALVQVMRGNDVVASGLGPFHRFELPLARAAIEAGVDYASICDEWDAAEAVMAELDAPARDAGRTVITGLGASPGLSNMGVRLLADRLDQVERVRIACYQPLDAGGGEAVLRHMMFIMTGKTAVWRDGRRQLVPACSEQITVEFPRFGEVRLWNMGHAEPSTVPRYLDGVGEVQFLLGFGRGSRALVAAAKIGLFSGRRRKGAWVRLAGWIERRFAGHEPGWGALRVDVSGLKDGVPHSYLVCGTGQMRETTGLSLAIGTKMLGRGQLSARHGVFAPEGCLPGGPFVEALIAAGVQAFEDLTLQTPLQIPR